MLKHIFIAIAILVFVGSAAASPTMPHVFYGYINAPDGAAVEGIVAGYITTDDNPVVVYDGKYGGASISEQKLLVQGNISTGAQIEFFVDGVSTGITYPYNPGEVTALNITPPVTTTVPTTTVTTTSPTTTATTYYNSGTGWSSYYSSSSTKTPTTVATTKTPTITQKTPVPTPQSLSVVTKQTTIAIPTLNIQPAANTTANITLEQTELKDADPIMMLVIIGGLISVVAVTAIWHRRKNRFDPLG